LARPDSASIAFIGCGVQARSHLDAFCDIFPLREIRAFGRGTANRDALCRAAEARGLTAVASETARDAIDGADLVVTSVTLLPKVEPFLDAPWLTEGMAAFERIVIDDLEQEAKAREPMVAPTLVAGDLLGLVCGDFPGRKSAKERTAFVFRGLALGDLALAGLAYRRSR
jgi:ornithine cyclodeaminase/alanine dehydrogenase